MGTYSSKFFDVQKTNDYFADIYSEFEQFKTDSQTHFAAIDDFSNTDQWQGADAEAGKTLMSNDVSNILTSILDAQDKIVQLQEDILTEFGADVDSSSTAKIKVSVLENIKGDFNDYYTELDYLATQAENCATYFQNEYGEYVTFPKVDLSNTRVSFKKFCGEGKDDDTGYLSECIQKLVDFDEATLTALQAEKLAHLINDIALSMGIDYTKDFNIFDFATSYKSHWVDEVYGKGSASNVPAVGAETGNSEPSWIRKDGVWICSVISGDYKYEERYQHGIKERPEDYKHNGIRTDYKTKKVAVETNFGKGKGKIDAANDKAKEWLNSSGHNLYQDGDKYAFHYVNDDKEGYIHKGRGKLGKDYDGTKYEGDDSEYASRINKDKLDKELFSVAEIGINGSKEYSAIDKYGRVGDEKNYAEGEIKVGTAEIHGGVNAGLYAYETTATGETKKILSPAVKAEVGVSAAAVDVSGNARGNIADNFDVYAKGNARALSAEAKAGVSINKNEAHVGASAEADLVKASGSVGVSIAGADVGVNGSVKVGIGAHADVGIKDGVIKCEVGAAVGVGVDFGFEVDAGGLVHAASDACKAAWDEAGDIAAGFKEDWNAFWN